ncbi:hypothetical protein [Anaeromicropila herbilytica]|uniref:Uncharacterized protein n=1 Tax=Anaeromicropila herbilytica TaxID=2785025 RepID=A0A7R7EKE1_9FIRM|nr:hypothetical protein [Anaeromicropila herbilytica]BCN30211.1 hypothetical protein bsdtb5_15060 [Anaeromicropila herbilytica]
MINKNFKKYIFSTLLAFSLSGTFMLTTTVNAQVSVISDTTVEEFDSTLSTSKWHPEGYYGFNKPTVTTGKLSVTCDGSTFQADGVTLSATSYGYRTYSTSLTLQPNTPYVMSGYVRATDVTINPNHIKDGRSPFGFSIRDDDYGDSSNQKTKTTLLLNSETNSTDGWKKLDFHFISNSSGNTILECHLGSFYCDAKGTVEFAGVTLKEDSSYRKVSFSNFAAAVPVSQLEKYSVSDVALDNWGAKLNDAAQKLQQLTGKVRGVTQCYFHNNQSLDNDYGEPYACAGAPCHFRTDASDDTMKTAPNQDAVVHGQLHEISHTFNTDYNRVWNFNDEIFTNVRATYAVVENNTKVVCLPNIVPYQGIKYKDFYDDAWKNYITPTEDKTTHEMVYPYSKGYELFAMADVYLRMVYGDASDNLPALGWGVFTEFFTNGASYNPTNKIQLNPNLNYSDDFKVFTNSLNIIGQIAGKNPYEIARYIPNAMYWNWLNNPSQYPFVPIN